MFTFQPAVLVNTKYPFTFPPRTAIHLIPLWHMFLIQGRQTSEVIAFLFIEASRSLEVIGQSRRCSSWSAVKRQNNMETNID